MQWKSLTEYFVVITLTVNKICSAEFKTFLDISWLTANSLEEGIILHEGVIARTKEEVMEREKHTTTHWDIL